MMRGAVEDIQVLFNTSVNTTFFLEKDSIGAFTQWLQNDPLRVLLIGKQWQVVVFRYQLVQYPDYLKRRNRLKKLNIEINDNKPNAQDGLFTDEVERTYFSIGGVNHRQLAEFYVMVRRAAGNGWVNIISQDRSFERIPLLNTYFIGTSARAGSQGLPAQFDFIQDFKIHSQLARMVSARLDDPNRGGTIFDAITVLRDHIRTTSGLNRLDGRDLMHQAFDDANPIIRINPMIDTDPRHTQRNEQSGFHDFYCGVMKGMRNPLAHEGTASPFATSRYPDNATLLKYLSFLSVLCERADGYLP
jgi:uncharacterized protein (TIGR02391 family)